MVELLGGLLLLGGEPAGKIGAKLRLQHRHALFAAAAVTDGIFYGDLRRFAAVLEEHL